MKKVLYILGLLDDADIDWLAGAGTCVRLEPGATLMTEGQPMDCVYILLDGKVEIQVDGRVVEESGVGEFVGETSLLDPRPATSTFLAVTDIVALRIRIDWLNEKLRSDLSFALRMYRALAVFLAQRMRERNTRLKLGDAGALDEDVEIADEISEDILEEVELAAMRFVNVLDRFRHA